jgi:hypothetical protein
MQRAIVIAAVILGASYVLGNLHKVHPVDFGVPSVYLVNTITGSLWWCAAESCSKVAREQGANPFFVPDNLSPEKKAQ